MAKADDVVINISLDHEEFDRELEAMEARSLRLLVLQLTARMDEAERHIITLQRQIVAVVENVSNLDEILDEGLDSIYESVKNITLQSFGSEGEVKHDTEEKAEWTEVRKPRRWWPK